MDDLKAGLVILFVIIMVIVTLFVALNLMSVPFEYMFCKEQAELNTQLEYEWLFWGGGCRVELPSGIWIDAHDIGEYQKHFLLEEIE